MSSKTIRRIKRAYRLTKKGKLVPAIQHKMERNYRDKVIATRPIDPKKIVFITFQGKYTCNPKAIADELIRRDLGYKMVWVVRQENLDQGEKYPEGVKLVVRNSREMHDEMATAKFIIQNANDTSYLQFKKREGQVVLQTWHGSLGFKRLDVPNVGTKAWKKKARRARNITDYIISNSGFENDVYRTSFWPRTKILVFGHARNDVLINEPQRKKMEGVVRDFYQIPQETKIAIYAPTFRLDTLTDSCQSYYDLDYEKLLGALRQRFGGDWKLLVRYHFKLRNKDLPSISSDDVIDATAYGDMQDLLCAADVGITDYSSWILDYMLTGRPGFLYANDIQDYVDERGFYYSLNETPFPITSSNDELEQSILDFDADQYEEKRRTFLELRDCREDGHASERIVDKIESIGRGEPDTEEMVPILVKETPQEESETEEEETEETAEEISEGVSEEVSEKVSEEEDA